MRPLAAILLAAAPIQRHPPPRELLAAIQQTPRPEPLRASLLPRWAQARVDAVLGRIDVSGNAICIKIRW